MSLFVKGLKPKGGRLSGCMTCIYNSMFLKDGGRVYCVDLEGPCGQFQQVQAVTKRVTSVNVEWKKWHDEWDAKIAAQKGKR